MLQLKLTDEQAVALHDALDHILSDLSVEIADTDRKGYRDELKAKRELLKEIADMVNMSA